jgi:GT2 family glycosyltransferase
MSLPDDPATKDQLTRHQRQELARVQNELEQAQRQNAEAWQRVDLLERENREIRSVLESMEHSVAWKFVKRYRRVKNALLPQGTFWRRAYDRLQRRLKGSAAASASQATANNSSPSPQEAGGQPNQKGDRNWKTSVRVEGAPGGGSEPLCSIIIPVFNRAQFTRVCLHAIVESISAKETPYELIVVDNGSTDETAHFLRAWSSSHGNARLISIAENVGFANACNEGARLAQGKYIVLLNNDTLPTPGWLDHMVRLAESGTQIGIVGSKLLFPNGRIQHIGVAFDEKKNPRHIYRGFSADIAPARISREYQAVTGACLLMARELYASVGGMDDSYENSYEETDLCFKVRARGYRVLVCADSLVYHFEGMSEGRRANDFRNAARFKARWEKDIECDANRWHQVDTLPACETEFETHEGYDPAQENWLNELWRRVYALPFPNGDV